MSEVTVRYAVLCGKLSSERERERERGRQRERERERKGEGHRGGPVGAPRRYIVMISLYD